MHLHLFNPLPQIPHHAAKLLALAELHMPLDTRPPNKDAKRLLLLGFPLALGLDALRLNGPPARQPQRAGVGHARRGVRKRRKRRVVGGLGDGQRVVQRYALGDGRVEGRWPRRRGQLDVEEVRRRAEEGG